MLCFVWKFGTVVACQAVANIVKSSLGPVGLDKVWFCGDVCIYWLFGFIFSGNAVGCG